jgi:transcriptional regulator
MYIPGFNKIDDRATLLEAMRTYSFAILFGPAGPDTPLCATHLPLIVRDEGPHGTLLGHFARANGHWSALDRRETLVVFPGPHTFVSPTLYTEPNSVPTWNYIAIHAYGALETVEDPVGKNALVEELAELHEPGYLDRWRQIPDAVRNRLLNNIIGFRMPISRIEGKFKISQNRNATERVNVHAAQASGSQDEQELALWMQRLNLVSPRQETKAGPR